MYDIIYNMILKTFSAADSETATAAVIEELKKNNSAGSRHIVIVPDRFSLSVERDIFESLKLPGAVNIDVVSFTRLAIKELGANAKKCLTKEGAVIVLRQVIGKNADKLSHYNSIVGNAGFAKELFAVIASIRNSGYTPEDLEKVVPQLIRSTKKKFADISILYKEYIKELEGRFEDSSTRLEKFIKAVPTSEKIAASDIYLIGFPTFTGKQREIITALTKRAKSVNVAATPTNYGSNADRYPSETVETLRDIASIAGVRFQNVPVLGKVKEPFFTLNREVFTRSGHVGEVANAAAVTVYAEKNVFEEVNGIAHEIARLIRREGYRYKDIAILNCNASNTPIIKSVFKRYGIPVFSDTKYTLKSTLLSRFVTAVAEAKIFGLRSDKVLNLVKEPLFGAEANARDTFENIVLKYSINFNRFTQELPTEAGEEVEAVRKKLIETVAVMPEEADAAEYCEIFKSLIGGKAAENDVFDNLSARGDEYVCAVNGQAEGRLLAVLDELNSLLSEEKLTLREFYDLYFSSVNAQNISIIPQFIDNVFCGDLHESRYDNLRALFIMGATADKLPAPHSYQAIATAADIDMLAECDFRMYPTPADLIREDEFLLLELFTKIKDKLYIGCAYAGADGAPQSPSPVIKEICGILGIPSVSLYEKYSLTAAVTREEQEDLAVTEENAFFTFLSNKNRETKQGVTVTQTLANLFASLSEASKDKLSATESSAESRVDCGAETYFKKGDGGYLASVTPIETFYTCPYRLHLQHGIKLTERDEGGLKPLDAGIFIHEVLERYFKTVKDKLDVLNDDELAYYADVAVREATEAVFSDAVTVSGLVEASQRGLFDESRRACLLLTKYVLHGAYRPKYTELGFGFGGKLKPIVVDAGANRFLFRGRIDRLDVCGNRAIIIDYKTGHVGDNPSAGLYFGNKLQLYFYQNAVKELGYIPSGTFYVPIRDTRGGSYRAVGDYDVSEENIRALDAGLFSGLAVSDKSESEGYPIKLSVNKGGEIKISGTAANTSEDLVAATEYAKAMIKNALELIDDGVIPRSPLAGNCKYCTYRAVCGSDGENNARKTSTAAKTSVFAATGAREGAEDEQS